MTKSLQQETLISSKSTQLPQQSLRQISKQKITITFHKKRIQNKCEEIFDIQAIPSACLYQSDLKTDLNPKEINDILSENSSNKQEFQFKKENSFLYKITKNLKMKDFVFNEETEEIDEVEIDIQLNFTLQIFKIEDHKDKYTIKFQNYSRDYELEYTNTCAEIINQLKSY